MNLPFIDSAFNEPGTPMAVTPTSFSKASVDVPDGVSDEQVRRVVARAEQTCLIANSLNAPCHVDAQIHVVQNTT